VISLDRRVEHWIASHRTGVVDQISVFLSRIGTLGLVWILIAALLALLWRRPWLLVSVLVAVLAADLLADLGKLIVHRHRPFEHQLGPRTSTHSFPSGHTATSFAAATVLSWWAPRLRVPLYVLATLIALSRLYNGDHYPLDVLGGLALGLLVGFAITRALARRGRATAPRPRAEDRPPRRRERQRG
jgi:undecaprenyl-diphosphatase